jgi:hypothetical protein
MQDTVAWTICLAINIGTTGIMHSKLIQEKGAMGSRVIQECMHCC